MIFGVLSLPWDKTGTQRLVYDGEGAPPCQVIVQQPGTLKCSCPKFKSAMICAHSLAVAVSSRVFGPSWEEEE